MTRILVINPDGSEAVIDAVVATLRIPACPVVGHTRQATAAIGAILLAGTEP